MLDDHSKLEPPDPIPNSEVKRLSADGSVGSPHVRVGHRQAPNNNPPFFEGRVFYWIEENAEVFNRFRWIFFSSSVYMPRELIGF